MILFLSLFFSQPCNPSLRTELENLQSLALIIQQCKKSIRIMISEYKQFEVLIDMKRKLDKSNTHFKMRLWLTEKPVTK